MAPALDDMDHAVEDIEVEAEVHFEDDSKLGKKSLRFSVEPLDIIAIAALLVAVIIAIGSYTAGDGLDTTSAGVITALLGASAITAYKGNKKKGEKE